jgi:hypothetical protein
MRDRVLGAEPAARVEVEVALCPGRSLLQLGRERGQHFQPSVCQHTAEAELCGRGWCNEQRLRLGGGEACQLRPVATRKSIAACRPANGLDRNACCRERLDVAVHGTDRHLEVRGELLRGQLAPHLEQEQQRNEPRRPHRAGTYMTEPGMYICQALGMSEEQQEQQSELEREERRLERLRLVVMPRPEPWEEDEPDPQQAA